MGLRPIPAAAVLALVSLLLGTSTSVASDTQTAKVVCKLAGIRYAGAGAGKAAVCFTLSADRKTIREYAFEPCAAADVALGQSRFARRVPVAANGSFTARGSTLAAGGAGLGFVNLTFTGRVQGKTASGKLTLEAVGTGSRFTCSWSARRTAASSTAPATPATPAPAASAGARGGSASGKLVRRDVAGAGGELDRVERRPDGDRLCDRIRRSLQRRRRVRRRGLGERATDGSDRPRRVVCLQRSRHVERPARPVRRHVPREFHESDHGHGNVPDGHVPVAGRRGQLRVPHRHPHLDGEGERVGRSPRLRTAGVNEELDGAVPAANRRLGGRHDLPAGGCDAFGSVTQRRFEVVVPRGRRR